MQFSDILTEARRLVKASSVSYPTSEITSSANSALEREVGIIRQAQGRWQWDDSNQTDLPFATTALVTDQQDYSLDPSHYQIERIEVKDTAGNWVKLLSIDNADLYSRAITDFLSTSGMPQYYDKVGGSLLLYPASDYSQADSLKIFYERGPSYFTTSDTTKTPGFNPLYHELIPLWCAYDYAFINGLAIKDSLYADRGNGVFTGRIPDMENEMREYYARRDKDEHVTLKARILNYR